MPFAGMVLPRRVWRLRRTSSGCLSGDDPPLAGRLSPRSAEPNCQWNHDGNAWLMPRRSDVDTNSLDNRSGHLRRPPQPRYRQHADWRSYRWRPRRGRWPGGASPARQKTRLIFQNRALTHCANSWPKKLLLSRRNNPQPLVGAKPSNGWRFAIGFLFSHTTSGYRLAAWVPHCARLTECRHGSCWRCYGGPVARPRLSGVSLHTTELPNSAN